MKRLIAKDYISKNNKPYKNTILWNLLYSGENVDNSLKDSTTSSDRVRFYNSFLIKDMNRALERIDTAIRSGETITLYGGHSIEGIIGTSMLYRIFRKLGVQLNYYIDDHSTRKNGINYEAIDYIGSLATDLIITVDTGVNSIQEINYSKLKGMDVVVLDHHRCTGDMPDTIVINPGRDGCGYQYDSLSGCGVIFKLIQALWNYYGLTGHEDILDIAVIGIASETFAASEENNDIVNLGLQMLQKSEKCGIQALKAVLGIATYIDLNQIASEIVPKIDAPVRLFDPRIVVELFTTNDYDKALQIAKYLVMETRNRLTAGEKMYL